MRLSYRLVSGLLVLASIVGMSFALYLEHVKGLEPCPLCIFQRVGLMAMGLVALIAFLHNKGNRIRCNIGRGLTAHGLMLFWVKRLTSWIDLYYAVFCHRI